jgi:FlaG/FlaF family flagellin (archaellin)
MKLLKSFLILLLFGAVSCVSVKVTSDYDNKTDFSKFKTFAFYKKGIDNVELSDLDKRRILHAIEDQLLAKGMTKSENPDVLVSIFTKSKENIDVYDNNYYGWYPWYYGSGFYGRGMYDQVIKSTEGTLFIDIIDTTTKELAWQGVGVGLLNFSDDKVKKEERIKEFVTEIMKKYPPMN